jgi:hypothetical protein
MQKQIKLFDKDIVKDKNKYLRNYNYKKELLISLRTKDK